MAQHTPREDSGLFEDPAYSISSAQSGGSRASLPGAFDLTRFFFMLSSFRAPRFRPIETRRLIYLLAAWSTVIMLQDTPPAMLMDLWKMNHEMEEMWD